MDEPSHHRVPDAVGVPDGVADRGDRSNDEHADDGFHVQGEPVGFYSAFPFDKECNGLTAEHAEIAENSLGFSLRAPRARR